MSKRTESGNEHGSRTFRLSVITPYEIFLDEACELLSFTTADGSMGIMAGHTSMVAALLPGELGITLKSDKRTAFVSNGYVQVESNYVLVVTNAAEWPEDIDIARAEASVQRGLLRMQKEGADAHDLKLGKHAVRRGQKRIDIARKFQGKPQKTAAGPNRSDENPRG